MDLLIVSSVLLGVLTLVFLALLTLLWKRRNSQPLKKKSPNLIIISTAGNMLFCLVMLLQQVLFYGCLVRSDLPACQDATVSNLNCLLGLSLLSVCEPLCIVPYYLRSTRLYWIFKAQEYYFRKKKKPLHWLKNIKERTLIRLSLLLALALCIATLGLFLGYCLGRSDVFLYLPSYNVQVCYAASDDWAAISLHTNISCSLIMLLHALQCLGLLAAVHKLRHIKDDFNIRDELHAVLAVWFAASFLATAAFVYSDAQKWEYLTFLLVARSLAVALITGVKPLYQTYLNKSFILLPPSASSIESLDMVLVIPMASDFFYNYLDARADDPQAPFLFGLYADLRMYDKQCQDEEDERVRLESAHYINDNYLQPEGQYQVAVQEDVRRAVQLKFANLADNLDEYLFIELYAFVLDRLREHFQRFKGSTDFTELEQMIARQEKLYEVLVDASIVTN